MAKFSGVRLQLAGLCVYAAACVYGVVTGNHYAITAGGFVCLAAIMFGGRRRGR